MKIEKVETVRLLTEHSQYGNRPALTSGLVSPEFVDIMGSDRLLASHKIGMLCSIRCPGSVIIRIYDLMRDLRNESITVVSGFHSPMEKECLNILLRGKCGVVVCYARSLPTRVPAEFRKPIDEGKLLLLSAFGAAQNRITRASSAARNRQVADLADALFIPYASPGGMVEGICREAIGSGKPVITFDGDPGAPLRAMGAKSVASREINTGGQRE